MMWTRKQPEQNSRAESLTNKPIGDAVSGIALSGIFIFFILLFFLSASYCMAEGKSVAKEPSEVLLEKHENEWDKVISGFSFLLASLAVMATVFGVYIGYTGWRTGKEYEREVVRAKSGAVKAELAADKAEGALADIRERGEKAIERLHQEAARAAEQGKNEFETFVKNASRIWRISDSFTRAEYASKELRWSDSSDRVEILIPIESDLLITIRSELVYCEEKRVMIKGDQIQSFTDDMHNIKVDIDGVKVKFQDKTSHLLTLCDEILEVLTRLSEQTN